MKNKIKRTTCQIWSTSNNKQQHVLTPTVEIMSHTKGHTQWCCIKARDVKDKWMKILCGSSHPKHFPEINVSEKKSKSLKEWNWVPATLVSPNNVTKTNTPSKITSNNFANILIYLNSRIVASKISDKSLGIN